MKKILTGLALILFVGSMVAQDFKSANKAFKNFKYDREKNYGELEKAKEGIDAAILNEESAGLASVWLLRGQIYNEISNHELAKLRHLDAADSAFEALNKVLVLTPKKFEKTAAIDGMLKTGNGFREQAVRNYESENFEGAFKAFNNMLKIQKFLKENGNSDYLSEKADLQQIKFFAGMTAARAGKNDEAKVLLKELQSEGYSDPDFYKTYFDILVKDDEKEALSLMESGRKEISAKLAKMDKSDEANAEEITRLESSLTGLLFSEINYYSGKGELDILESKLKEAIEKEPENISLFSNLGKLYDDLYQKKGEEHYFSQAKEYYEKAISIDNTYLQAIYNLGALYFNKAAAMNKTLADIVDMKAYEAKKKEVDQLFDEALPYFLSAEKIDKNDRNTLIALKEIYAIKDDLVKSGEYKKRIEGL